MNDKEEKNLLILLYLAVIFNIILNIILIVKTIGG